MTKNPSDTWFYNDWKNADDLKTCSLAAQGLWMRLLCIAAASPERGVVQIGSLDFSHPAGLTQIAAAIGRSPEEIAPLIDDLISSGTASLDRKKRIYCRRMVRAAKTSEARAESGREGANVTNGKRWGKRVLGQQNVGNGVSKPSASSSLPASSSPSHGDTITAAPRASASPDGPPRTGLTSDEVWQQRLEGYDPHNPRKTWQPFWGPRPDAPGSQPAIPTHLMQWWKAKSARQGIDA